MAGTNHALLRASTVRTVRLDFSGPGGDRRINTSPCKCPAPESSRTAPALTGYSQEPLSYQKSSRASDLLWLAFELSLPSVPVRWPLPRSSLS